MKNILILVGLLFLSIGCSRVNSDITTMKPNEWGVDDSFRGKIFAIKCTGNQYTPESKVQKTCLTEISSIAHQTGYKYFTIIDKKNSSKPMLNIPLIIASTSNKSAYISQSNYYNEIQHSNTFVFLLIEPNQRKDFNNYYVVSDYYPEKEK